MLHKIIIKEKFPRTFRVVKIPFNPRAFQTFNKAKDMSSSWAPFTNRSNQQTTLYFIIPTRPDKRENATHNLLYKRIWRIRESLKEVNKLGEPESLNNGNLTDGGQVTL